MKRHRTVSVLVVAALVSALRLTCGQEQNSELSNPTALAFDNAGNLFVASYPSTILKFAADGSKSTFAKDVSGSSGLVFNNAGDLFVLGADSSSIVKFTAEGDKTVFATGIHNPQGLACDGAGNLFVSEVGTESILRFAPNGSKTTFATGISVPRNIAFDGSGNLFVYDASANSIFKISPDGAKTAFANGLSASSLIVDKSGNLFVGDVKSQAILKFAPNGSTTTFVDAIPAPGGLAFDNAGDLFVSDQGTDSILKISVNGVRTVFYKASSQTSVADEEGEEHDSSAGLPEKYASDYLIAAQTVSPDKNFAVMYPNEAMEEKEKAIKDYLVTLHPFSILKPLDTKSPYFEDKSNAELIAEWSDDSSVGLITLDSKWGPGDVLLLEMRNGKLSRMTNISRKACDLLLPDYRKAKAERYNDYFPFVFMEDARFKLDGTKRVLIEAEADTSPNDLGLSERAWRGYVAAVWDIPSAKFTSTKVSGHRRKKRQPGSDDAEMYSARGEEDARQRDFEKAIADYTQAIELFPKSSEAFRERGVAKAKKKDPDLDGATADLDRAIQLDLSDAAAYAARADIEAKRKQYAAAIKDEQKAVDLDLVKGPYYTDLAWYQLLNRNPREAIETCQKAFQWSPSDAVTINANLADAYLFDNQFDKAKAIYLENKDAKLDNERSFRQAVLDDFKELQQAGITHPDMDKIKAILTNKPDAR